MAPQRHMCWTAGKGCMTDETDHIIATCQDVSYSPSKSPSKQSKVAVRQTLSHHHAAPLAEVEDHGTRIKRVGFDLNSDAGRLLECVRSSAPYKYASSYLILEHQVHHIIGHAPQHPRRLFRRTADFSRPLRYPRTLRVGGVIASIEQRPLL